eukprot:3015991-Alexandrium_andersonii.AAC.1
MCGTTCSGVGAVSHASAMAKAAWKITSGAESGDGARWVWCVGCSCPRPLGRRSGRELRRGDR